MPGNADLLPITLPRSRLTLLQIWFTATGANLLARHIPQADRCGETVLGRRGGQRLSDHGADGHAP